MGLREGLHLDSLHARLRLSVRARDDGFIQGNLTQLARLGFSANRESLPRGSNLEQRQQRMRAADGVHPSSDRPDRIANRLAFGTLERFAQLPAVCHLRARGTQRLERRFGLSRLRADAKREARTMDSPVIRVQIGIEDLSVERGSRTSPSMVPCSPTSGEPSRSRRTRAAIPLRGRPLEGALPA